MKKSIKKESVKQLVLFMNYPYQIYSNDPTKIHVTLFKPDFKPAEGAVVRVNNKTVGKADKNGILIFDYKPGSKGSHTLTANLQDGKTKYAVHKTFACNGRTASFVADRLYVYTDRGVYNPGQDILIRLLAWRLKGEYFPVKEAKVQLLFQDRNGKVYSGEYVTTDSFGVGATKLSVPESMPEGDYELVVLYNKTRETTSLRVKRFVPPVINIKHDLKRYFTDTQEELNAKVSLSYFTGGKMKSTGLIFSVLTPDKKEVFKKSYSSDKGEYDIKLSKNDLDTFRNKLTQEAPFKIKLEASDPFKQKDEIIWDITYTARPFQAVLEVDKDSYIKDEKVQILAKIVDLDGQPAAKIPLTFEVTGTKIKKEVKTDAKGVAVLEFSMPQMNVTVNLKSPVMKSILASRYISFQAPKPMISKVSEPPKGANVKTVIRVYFDKEYIPVEKVVHIDMTDISGALVISTTIPVFKEEKKYMAKGEITAPTWGTMLANLYCCAVHEKNAKKPLSVNTVGFITEGQHITFYPDKEMEIIVENFKPSASPGEKATFKVIVKGGKGEKSLGVSVVDGAVISLLDPFIIDPVNHFYNPQAKVISTGGAGVLTWPVVDRNWGSPWRDIAYTDWGWKSPGSFISSVPQRATKGNGGNGDEDEYAETEAPAGTMMEKEGMGMPASEPKKKMSLNKADLSDGKFARRDQKTKTEAPKTIVIRKEFPETALWEPKLITKDKKAEFTVKMPDSITIQKLAILATDKDGFMGFLRKDIRVTQPLFVRALFPAVMTYNDEIRVQALVQNQNDKEIKCTVTLSSPSGGLKITDQKSKDIKIKANESQMVEWEISSEICGENTFTVSAETSDFKDSEEKKIMVLPAGLPLIQAANGIVKDGKEYKHEFTLDKNAIYKQVTVQVALPNVFPAFQAWYAFDNYPWYSPWMTAANSIMNAAMLQYSRSTDKAKDKIDLLTQKLNEAVAQIIAQQSENGAWGWYFLADATAPDSRPVTGGENLYYTVYVLRAFLDIKESDIYVDDNVILKAMDYILKNRKAKGLWYSKGAYFWEVYNEGVDHALSSEIFEVLSHALLMVSSSKKYESQIAEVKEKMLELLKQREKEPMTFAAILKGLGYWAEYKKDESMKKIFAENIDYLIRLKRKGYWEPHWYHAYGGMVELNARILELLAEFDAKKYDSYLREGITWLLSTREAWGAWHNEIGTANAIRALLKIGAFAKEKECEIVLKVNDTIVKKIEVDPADPYLSAAKLKYFDITKWARDGQNSVEVEYDGNLTASVMVEVKQWGIEDLKSGQDLKIERKVSEKAMLGETVPVKISISGKKAIPIITIEDSIPSNTDVEVKSLDLLKNSKKIIDYRVEKGKLYLILEKINDKVDLEYRLSTIHNGKAQHAGLKVTDTSKGEVLASIVSSYLNVK
ncbi:MAG: hypothetical protein KKH98_10665 [Spirochaetes bacterium]|nr:hypothetical protein [Spirochaetota bacterium]